MTVKHSTDTCIVLIKNNLSELNTIVQTIDMIACKWNLTNKVKNQLNLAIEEVVSNILFYAYDDQVEHQIKIEFCCSPNSITIIISDDGKSFNLLDAAKEVDISASVDEREIGGLGIHLLKTLMDNIEYQRNENKNILKITKHF